MLRALALSGCAVALLAGCSHHATPSLVPEQSVEMDNHTLHKFEEEVAEYVELRQSVITKIPEAAATSDADQLAAHQRAFTAAIVRYRKGSKRGDIFKPSVEAALRRILQKEFSGPGGQDLIKAIKQGNPKIEGNPSPADPSKESRRNVDLSVNAVYDSAAPFSSVPPGLLLKMPLLPESVRYRFVGRALILRDADANVILDFIQDVVPDTSIPR
jgi:hypothetical protein